VLRNVKFTEERYESFIALQDKLHANLARQRTLVSMGTHDLDKIKGPFHYKALPPKDFSFIPLNQKKGMNGEQLMEFYEKDRHLAKFLPIIRDSPVYPIIFDSNDVVLSMPPIINGEHSKITLDTKNIFIEMTATDKTKAEIVNHIMVTMFSEYCSEPFTIEQVHIISDHNNETRHAPDLTPKSFTAEVSYLNGCTGLSLTAQQQCDLLGRMCDFARPSKSKPKEQLDVLVPVTRSDILHQADIMEDLAVAYGFNKLPRFYPSKYAFVAAPLPINKLSDIVRAEAAMAGWTEVMPLILCSHDENFAWLNRKDDGKTAIHLQNPKSQEYQIVRTSLLPGLLLSIQNNKHRPIPLKIFEASDIGLKDESRERKTRNERHFAALWYGKTSGFEVVHGVLDRVMAMLNAEFIDPEEGNESPENDGYWIEEFESESYYPALKCLECADISFRSYVLDWPCSEYSFEHRRQAPYHRRIRYFTSHGAEELRTSVRCKRAGAQSRSVFVEV